MRHGYLASLLALSALWGSSYLFIKVADRELEPATLIAFRLVLAGAVLLALLVGTAGARGALAELRAVGPQGVVLGVINNAIPFWLIAWGETHVDSGVAAVANSTVPMFVALLAIRLRPSERSTGARLAGILVGLAGVGVLTGVHPEGGGLAVAGTLAVVLSSVSYARSNLYVQDHFAHVRPLTLATAAILSSAVLMLPFGLLQLPAAVPGWKTLGSVAALAVLGTAVAYLIVYRMISRYGSSRAALVTYLLPVFALAYGALILGEPLRLSALLGLALILAGVALGSGLVRARRRAAPATSP